jgi:signal transduction histidine kinase
VEIVQEDGTTQQLAVVHVDPSKVELAARLRAKYPPNPAAPSGVHNVLRTGRSELYEDVPDELLVRSAVDEEHLAMTRALGLRSAIIAPIVTPRGTVGAISFVAAESGRRYRRADVARAEELASRAALAIENSTLYRGAQQAINLRDDFLAIAGHELRTPLTALMLQLQNVRKRFAQNKIEPALLIERLVSAEANVDRLHRLVEELLTVSRVVGGRLVLDCQEMDLVEMVRDIAHRCEPELVKAGCELKLDSSAAVNGSWDRFRLEGVVTNLLTNAIKYGRGSPVEIAVRGEGGRGIVAVTDHGIGILEADKQRIFGRFERGVSERDFGGLGLGLWIAKQIVDAHGGEVTVESTPGVATTFVVSLPRNGNGGDAPAA